MSKKENKEGFFAKLREWWQIPRYKSLIILGIYFVFFGLVMLYSTIIGSISSSDNEMPKVDATTRLSIMDNYEYEYDVEAITPTGVFGYSVSGIRYDDTDNFEVLNNDFYIKDNIIYSVNENVDINSIVQFDLMLLRPDKIYEFLKLSTLTDKVEYEDGSIKYIYSIPVSDFNIAFLQEIDENNTDVVEITLYEVEDYITGIDLNIVNLMKLVDSSVLSYTIEMEYSNIDNIKNVEELK